MTTVLHVVSLGSCQEKYVITQMQFLVEYGQKVTEYSALTDGHQVPLWCQVGEHAVHVVVTDVDTSVGPQGVQSGHLMLPQSADLHIRLTASMQNNRCNFNLYS